MKMLALFLSAAAAGAAMAARVEQVTLDLERPKRAFALSITEQTDTTLRAALRASGAEFDPEGWAGLLWYGTEAGGITITNSTASYGSMEWAVPASAVPTNGRYYVQILGVSGGDTVEEWGLGTLSVRLSPSAGSLPADWLAGNAAYIGATNALSRVTALEGGTDNWNTAFSWGDHAGLYREIGWVPSWGDLTDIPQDFPPSTHEHDYTTITNPPWLTSFTETDEIALSRVTIIEANTSNWNTAYSWGNHAGLYKGIGWFPTWAEVTGKPDLFDYNYDSLTNKPATFPPSAHTHPYTDITDPPWLTEYIETDEIALAALYGTNAILRAAITNEAALRAAHTNDTENPHGVTAAQIGALTEEADATALAALASFADTNRVTRLWGADVADEWMTITNGVAAVWRVTAVTNDGYRVVSYWGQHAEQYYPDVFFSFLYDDTTTNAAIVTRTIMYTNETAELMLSWERTGNTNGTWTGTGTWYSNDPANSEFSGYYEWPAGGILVDKWLDEEIEIAADEDVIFSTNLVSVFATTQHVAQAVEGKVDVDGGTATNLWLQGETIVSDSYTNLWWRNVYSNGWHWLVAYTNAPGGGE